MLDKLSSIKKLQYNTTGFAPCFLCFACPSKTYSRNELAAQDDGLVGIPSKFNRYKRGGKKVDDSDKPGDGNNNTAKNSSASNGTSSVEDGEGEVGGGAGLTLIKIRLFKEVKKDEASP